MTFAVSTADLHALASALSGLSNDLSTAGQLQVDAGAAGHPQVEAALGSFLSNWSDGLHTVETNLAKFTERLGAAADDYDAVDGRVGASFDGA